MNDFLRAKVDSEMDRIDKIDKKDDEQISAVRGKERQLTEAYMERTKALLAFVDSFGPGDKMKHEVISGLLTHLQRVDKGGLVRQQKAFSDRVDKYFEKINLRARNPGEVWKMDIRIIMETDFTLAFGFEIPKAFLQKFYEGFKPQDFEIFSHKMKQLNSVAFNSRYSREVMRMSYATFAKALTLASSGKIGQAIDLIEEIMVKIDESKDALKPLVKLRQERRAIDAKRDAYFVVLRKMHENLKSKAKDADIVKAKDAVEVAAAYFVLVESFGPFVALLQAAKNPDLLMSADPALFVVEIAVIRPGKPASNGRVSMEVFKEILKIPKSLQDFEILKRSAMRVLTAAKAELFLVSGEEAYRGDFEKDVDERQKNVDDNGQSVLTKAMEADFHERFSDGMPVVVKGTPEYEAVSGLLKILSGRQAAIEKLRVSDSVGAFSAANEFFKGMANLHADLTGGLTGALTRRETTFILPTELTFFTPVNLKLLQGLKDTSPRAYGFLMKMLEIHQARISQIARDIIAKDPEILKFQREFGAFMKSGEGLFKTFEDLMRNIQQGKTPTKAEMAIVHKAVDDYVDSPYFKNIRNIWPLEKFRAYEKVAADKMPGVASVLTGLLNAYDALNTYIETVGKIAEELKDISGDMVGMLGFIKDAGKLLIIIAAAVSTGGALAGVGVSAFAVMSTVTLVSTMSGATLDYLDGNKHAFDPGTLIENYARGFVTSYAAGALSKPVGMLWGNLAKRLNDRLIQSNIGFLRNFAEKGYMVRALEAADDAAEKGGALRKMFGEMTEETAEEGLEAIGQAIAPHDPIVGFVFSLLGSSASHARGAFRKGNFSLTKYNVDVQVTDAGIVVEYDPAKADINGLLKDYGLTDVFADVGSSGTVVKSGNGVTVELRNVGAKAQFDLDKYKREIEAKYGEYSKLKPEIEAGIRSHLKQYEDLRREISTLPAEYQAVAHAIIDARIGGIEKTLQDILNGRPVELRRFTCPVNLSFRGLIDAHKKISEMEQSLNALPLEFQAELRQTLAEAKEEFLRSYKGDLSGKVSQASQDLDRRLGWIENKKKAVQENPEFGQFALKTLGRIPAGKLRENLESLRQKILKFREAFAQLDQIEVLCKIYPEFKIYDENLNAIRVLRAIASGEITGEAIVSEGGTMLATNIELAMQRAGSPEAVIAYMKLIERFDQEIGQKASPNQKNEIARIYRELVIRGSLSHETFKERFNAFQRVYANLADLPALNPEGREQYAANIALTLENFLVEKIIEKGMDPSKIEKAIREKYSETARTAEVTININYVPLEKVLDEGRFRTYEDLDVQHREDGLFGKTGYGERRAARDRQIGHSEKFVVGALSGGNGFDQTVGPAPFYGHGVVRLKPDRVRGRVKFFEGDSLTPKEIARAVNPNWLIRKWDDISSRTLDQQGAILSKSLMELELENVGATHAHTMYVEAHIIGNVTLDDISSITYGVISPDEEIARLQSLAQEGDENLRLHMNYEIEAIRAREAVKQQKLAAIRAKAEARGIKFTVVELEGEINPVDDPFRKGSQKRQLTVDEEYGNPSAKPSTSVR